jgi:aldose 1-epimerase
MDVTMTGGRLLANLVTASVMVGAMAKTTHAATAERASFGTLADGTPVPVVELRNSKGIRARVIAYGASLQSLEAPDRHGTVDLITLGYDTIAGYEQQRMYNGVTVGRYANRIAGARFSLDGRSYQLATNDGSNSLHGGTRGFDKRLWSIVEVAAAKESASVTLSLTSADDEEHFPGNLSVRVTYTLSEANALTISYVATTDKPTIVNLTHHSLFNLGGLSSGRSALDSELQVEADSYTPIDAQLIPTGAISPVAATPLDFRKPGRISTRVRDASDPQILLGRGIDHNFVIRGGVTASPKLAATLRDPESGRTLRVLTTEPGLQVYTANVMDGSVPGHGGRLMRQGDGVAFEAQKYPDTPNQPTFPTARLDPGQRYEQVTVFQLSW